MYNFDGSFFDRDYFMNGKKTGKSHYENYHWMPQRSFREALALIDYLGLTEKDNVLDFGCSMGFLVTALRMLEIPADGCDISEYALSFAPEGCWNCSGRESFTSHRSIYTHIIIKDVLEHMTPSKLCEMLNMLTKIAPKLLCIVPMGDYGVYRIPEYHEDKSHIIAEDEQWWTHQFIHNGWNIIGETSHISGIKDNWEYVSNGNHVFLLEKQ